MNKDLQDRTAMNRQLMLEQLQKIPIVQVCCEKLSIARSTYYRWREESPEFAKQADKALAEGVALINDLTESQLLSAIKNGNISSIFYWLNHRHSVYSNKLEVTTKLDKETLTVEQEELIKKALEHASLIMKGGHNDANNQ
ncbi:MAG TPA: phBC6A51 family helix-turn-helix protein [Candidatus Woesebacteria bacterium]|nr:phBC6A51 family helix-turn-helix protein [Candidatus Woesebacteria bacterium]